MTLLAIFSDDSSGSRSNAEKMFHGEKCRLRLDVIVRAKLLELINSPKAYVSSTIGYIEVAEVFAP
jgi:hypothetical protein